MNPSTRDIVVRLAMLQVRMQGHKRWVDECDIVEEAMTTIINLRVDLYRKMEGVTE